MKAVRWRKTGLLFAPDGRLGWMRTHAALPTAMHRGGDVFDVFFGARDDAQRSSIGHLVAELGDTPRVLEIDSDPVLGPGQLGCFDDSGSMPSWMTTVGQDRYLYYIGWNRGVTVPFRNSAGLAVSRNGGEFKRYSTGPVLDRSIHEPQFATNPCVMKVGDVWRMWYISCVGWEAVDGNPRHRYHLKYVESMNGVDWRPSGQVAIDFSSPEEYAISRPCVVRDGAKWRMWYSYRGVAYRIGYAESDDGIAWRRRDDAVGIDVSKEGWDSQMIEYPFVFNHKGRSYMLYNGNGYGRTGFGLAVLEE
jgi:hypothetical protein